MTRKPHDPSQPARLSPQQHRVLWLFACGNTVANAATILMIKTPTAKEHLHRAYRILGARNGVHAVHLAYQLGIFQVEPDQEPDEAELSEVAA